MKELNAESCYFFKINVRSKLFRTPKETRLLPFLIRKQQASVRCIMSSSSCRPSPFCDWFPISGENLIHGIQAASQREMKSRDRQHGSTHATKCEESKLNVETSKISFHLTSGKFTISKQAFKVIDIVALTPTDTKVYINYSVRTNS